MLQFYIMTRKLCFKIVALSDLLFISPRYLKFLVIPNDCFVIFKIHFASYFCWSTQPSTANSLHIEVTITGCDRGFGFHVAKQLDRLGFLVFAGCLNVDGPGPSDLKQSSKRIHLLQLDVTKENDVTEAVTFVEDHTENKGMLFHDKLKLPKKFRSLLWSQTSWGSSMPSLLHFTSMFCVKHFILQTNMIRPNAKTSGRTLS